LNNLVAIAKTVKTRGLRGEIAADVLTDFPKRFETTSRVFAVKANGEKIELNLESFWFQKNRIVLKFENYDSIERAEELTNAEICIPESETVALGEDEFFDWQLANCLIKKVSGETIGTVREVMRTGGTEILVVTSAEQEQKDFLIPFAKSICVAVDIENKLISVDLPEGLLEF
jgi:16S rRNA processing protein RimM